MGKGEQVVEALSYAHWPNFLTVLKIQTSVISFVVGKMAKGGLIKSVAKKVVPIALAATAVDVSCDVWRNLRH